MRLIFRLMILWIGICVLSPNGFAEFYRYTDENGVVHFTDNLAEVPKDQRPDVTKYKEPEDFLTPQEKKIKDLREKADEEDRERRRASEETSEARRSINEGPRDTVEPP